MIERPQITFVCCVESGPLERQTVLMIESLRRWGGQFADAPVFAVTPRFGPPLANMTRRAFKKLHVEYLCIRQNSKYSWNKFLNKPYALVAVEKRTTSECIAWLDSDLLILGAPEQLILNEGEDFLACASDKNIGTTGLEDPFEPYWREVCNCVDIDIEHLPWIRTEREGALIRLYWNSGVFAYRHSTSFAEHYLQTCIQLFNSRIASQESGIFFNDQIALGLTMVKMGIPWRALPYSYNYAMGSKIHKTWYGEEQFQAARIVHYHDAMWPHFWPEFIKCLHVTHSQVADWLSSLGPLKNEAPFYYRSMDKILRYFRAQQETVYKNSCKVI